MVAERGSGWYSKKYQESDNTTSVCEISVEIQFEVIRTT